MKSKTDIEKQLGLLAEKDKETLEYLKAEIDKLITSNINEEFLDSLTAIENQLIIMRLTYTKRLIKLLKTNHMV